MEQVINSLRYSFQKDHTLSMIFVENRFFCYCIEPEKKSGRPVVGDRDAIPAGKYKIVDQYSPKYQKNMLRLENVPFNSGILFHVGNFPKDTAGCQCLGLQARVGGVLESVSAIHEFEKTVRQWLAKGVTVWYQIEELTYDEQLCLHII